jgi:hypothetical protein
MAQLRFAAHPKHRAIVLRREQDDLQEIIDRTRDIYPLVCRSAKWVATRKRWEFPSGASILMGSAERDNDIEAYKSFEFNMISFDELTTFSKYQYVYMLSRNRSKDVALPLMMRGGTNPDGPGHGWVYSRLVKGREPYKIYRVSTDLALPSGGSTVVKLTQQFIPATVFDNPDVPSRDEYIAGLMAMGGQLAEALLYGKWDYFRGQMFPYGRQGGLIEVDPGLKMKSHAVVRCLDYGWTDPTVVYWLIVYPNRPDGGPDIEIAREIVATETNIDGLATLIQRAQDSLSLAGVSPPTRSVIDPSTKSTQSTGRSTLDLFQEAGVWFEPANNDRQAGWGRLRQLLESGRIGYWRGEAPYLRSTLAKLVRDPNKADDIRNKQKDHGADSLRYGAMAIYDSLGITPSTPEQGPPPHHIDQVFDKLVDQLRHNRRESNLATPGLGEGW